MRADRLPHEMIPTVHVSQHTPRTRCEESHIKRHPDRSRLSSLPSPHPPSSSAAAPLPNLASPLLLLLLLLLLHGGETRRTRQEDPDQGRASRCLRSLPQGRPATSICSGPRPKVPACAAPPCRHIKYTYRLIPSSHVPPVHPSPSVP